MFGYVRAVLANRRVAMTIGAVCTVIGLRLLTGVLTEIQGEAEMWEGRAERAQANAGTEEQRLQALVAQRWSEEQAAAARAERVKVLAVNPDLGGPADPADEPRSMGDRVAARLAAGE